MLVGIPETVTTAPATSPLTGLTGAIRALPATQSLPDPVATGPDAPVSGLTFVRPPAVSTRVREVGGSETHSAPPAATTSGRRWREGRPVVRPRTTIGSAALLNFGSIRIKPPSSV